MSEMTRLTQVSTLVSPPAARPGAATGGAPEVPGGWGVPWLTVLPLAVVLAYADGWWTTSLRGAVGAIERTQGPFATWLRESTLALPVFALAVLGALTLALAWFGPAPPRPRTVIATAAIIAAATTVVGVAWVAAGSAYDLHLQSTQLDLMYSMRHTAAGALQAQQAAAGLQVRAVGFGAGIILVTNLVLIGWVLAIRGGALNLATTRNRTTPNPRRPHLAGPHRDQPANQSWAAGPTPQDTPATPATAPTSPADRADPAPRSRANDLRVLLASGLVGSAVIHAAVLPEHLTQWAAAGAFFIVLMVVEVGLAVALLVRPHSKVLLAAALASIGPLALWLFSRTAGLPFGPSAGVPEPVGLADVAACALEVVTLVAALVLLYGGRRLQRPGASAHVRSLAVVAVIAVMAIGLAGTGLSWFNVLGAVGQSGMTSSH